MSSQTTIALIICSQRQNRRCPNVATLVRQQAEAIEKSTDVAISTLDLLDWNLPMFDGSLEPVRFKSSTDYADPHIRRWSETVAKQDAFVFVTPQYNWGYPATIKNAIDHLFFEWKGKPAMIVTYGGHGGGKAADQLRQVLTALRMQTATTAPALQLANYEALVEILKRGESGGGDSGLPAPVLDFKKSIDQAYSELKALIPATETTAQAVTQSQGL